MVEELSPPRSCCGGRHQEKGEKCLLKVKKKNKKPREKFKKKLIVAKRREIVVEEKCVCRWKSFFPGVVGFGTQPAVRERKGDPREPKRCGSTTTTTTTGGPGRSSGKIAGCENSPLEELKEKSNGGRRRESEWETTDDEWPASKIF